MATLLAYGQRKITKITMAMFTTEKTNHQPHGLTWDRLAVWPELVAQMGQRLAARVTAGGAANALALLVWSGVCLSSFSAEPPQPIAGAGGKAQVTPFILIIKTDQMVAETVPAANQNKTVARQQRIKDKEKVFFTSGPDQFRLPLHPFAHYDFTVDWGDGTTEIVRSGAPARQAIVDETWLAQVKKGLDQTVTFSPFSDLSSEKLKLIYLSGNDVKKFNRSQLEERIEYLLTAAGIEVCKNIVVDPKVLEKDGLEQAKELVGKQTLGAMKLGEVFDELTKFTGLNYILHDRALLVTQRKDVPNLVCPQHRYAKAGTYKIKITENIIGGFPQIYFNGGYDCVKVMDLVQWGGNTWTSLDAAFMGCANMTISASDSATAVTGAVKNFSQAWSGCSGLSIFPLLNTTAGTDFSAAWSDCSGLTSFPLLNTIAGTGFSGAWSHCSGLTSFPLLNTSAGTNFSWAWYCCSGLTSFPLLNTSVGINFYGVWGGCSGLSSFPLLDTSAGTNFHQAWVACSGLTSFPLLNTSAGRHFNATWCGCSGLTSFPLLNTSAGNQFSGAWANCRGLTSFPLLNTSAGITFYFAWENCSGLTSFPLLNTSLGTDFALAWNQCSGLTSFPLLDTSAGTSFYGAWSGCRGLTNFPLLNFGKSEQAVDCFSGVTLTSASYGELLVNIAALNKISNVEFDGGFSKAQGLIGIQAREKLTKELGWTIYDGDHPKPVPKNEAPAKIQPQPQPQPEAANEF